MSVIIYLDKFSIIFLLAMPRDQATRNYIAYIAEKIRQQTTGHRYTGNFNQDAKTLGIKPEKLMEILKSKRNVTSIARDIFKTMFPEKEFSDKHWNNLPEDIRIKESFLIGKLSIIIENTNRIFL